MSAVPDVTFTTAGSTATTFTMPDYITQKGENSTGFVIFTLLGD